MPPRITPLMDSRTVTIAANGTGTIAIGPSVFGERWRITNTSVQNNGALRPVANVYRNVYSDSTFLEGTLTGNSDTSNTVFELNTSEKLVFRWENATPGSVSTVVIGGEKVYG